MSISRFSLGRVAQNGIDVGHPIASLARWPAWLLACATKRPTIARFRTGGIKMSLTPRLHTFGTTSLYIKRDFYEPELLSIGKLIKPGSVTLDIGGSFGVFALFMAHFAGPEGHVHSFEPGRFSFASLTHNIGLNGMEQRITAHRVAASDTPATLKLFHLGDSPVNFSIGAREGTESEEVAAVRIADIVPAADAARVSFIKIDVEGYEIAALEGARPILEARHPAIMFEVSAGALARVNHTPRDVYGYLAAYGYRFWRIENDGFTPLQDPVEGNIFASVGDLSNLSA